MFRTKEKVNTYITTWKTRGYSDGIPNIVPHELMKKNLAPSYKAIAQAILNNDLNLVSLGFSSEKSKWYSVLKRIEIENREEDKKRKKSVKRANMLF